MPALRELQSQLKAAILDGDLEAVAHLVQPDRLTAVDRLRIYRNHTRSSLVAALADNFPVTCRLVGREFFEAAAKRFIAGNPPSEPCLSAYGAAFPEFLAGFEAAQSLPYLPDVARLEWLRIEVTHASRPAPLDLEALAALPPVAQSGLILTLLPSVRLLASPYPIDRIWLANQETDVPAIDLNEGGCRLLVFGDAQVCYFGQLDAGTYAFFEAAARNETLAQAAENAFAADPNFELVQAFALHRTRGVLADTVSAPAR
ncbi:MAG: DNA-binding domain-containing protein [Dongiaceae bacterium]